jgi:hypothetical protein
MNSGTHTLLLVLCLSGITSSGPAAVMADEVDFQRQIAPILEEHCWHCHGEEEQESGLRLDRRASMLRGGDYGLPAVVPGKPEKSYLIEVVKHLDPDLKVPPDEDKLPAKQIDLLTRWIKEGATWPGQMDAVAEEKSDHWSFRPIVRPEVPGITTRSGKNNFGNGFLPAAFQGTGIPIPKFSKRTRCRLRLWTSPRQR